jgi:hypothetical protein
MKTIAPIIAILRPSLSPSMKLSAQPSRHPRLYIETIIPNSPGAGWPKTSRKLTFVIRPPNTPWSYPNRKKAWPQVIAIAVRVGRPEGNQFRDLIFGTLRSGEGLQVSEKQRRGSDNKQKQATVVELDIPVPGAVLEARYLQHFHGIACHRNRQVLRKIAKRVTPSPGPSP